MTVHNLPVDRDAIQTMQSSSRRVLCFDLKQRPNIGDEAPDCKFCALVRAPEPLFDEIKCSRGRCTAAWRSGQWCGGVGCPQLDHRSCTHQSRGDAEGSGGESGPGAVTRSRADRLCYDHLAITRDDWTAACSTGALGLALTCIPTLASRPWVARSSLFVHLVVDVVDNGLRRLSRPSNFYSQNVTLHH